jgi:hypothetical protein
MADLSEDGETLNSDDDDGEGGDGDFTKVSWLRTT